MEPEIARRCLDCGASVRGQAVFCPQCGRPLKVTDEARVPSAVEASERSAHRITDPGLNASTLGLSENAPPSPTPPALDNVPASNNFARGSAQEEHFRGVEAIAPERAVDDGGASSKRQRVTAAARDVVEEKLSPRVEKLRQASNVMLEEASYDPSLRFVLVALAAIALSLFLLLLNYLLG